MVKLFYFQNGIDYRLYLTKNKYVYTNSLALSLFDTDDLAPFANITVCLPDNKLSNERCGFIDTNNWPDLEDFIKENKLGKPTGRYGYSGYCKYPEYEFYQKIIDEAILM